MHPQTQTLDHPKSCSIDSQYFPVATLQRDSHSDLGHSSSCPSSIVPVVQGWGVAGSTMHLNLCTWLQGWSRKTEGPSISSCPLWLQLGRKCFLQWRMCGGGKDHLTTLCANLSFLWVLALLLLCHSHCTCCWKQIEQSILMRVSHNPPAAHRWDIYYYKAG